MAGSAVQLSTKNDDTVHVGSAALTDFCRITCQPDVIVGQKAGSRKHGAVARKFEKVHLMRRRKTAEFAKPDSDVTVAGSGVELALPWLLK
jgi:hypothetical protein